MTIFIGGLFDPFGQIPAGWMIHKSFSPLSRYLMYLYRINFS